MARTHEEERDSAFGHAPVPPDATSPYGEHPEQIIDFFAPRGGTAGAATGRPAPLVVLVHGGFWRQRYDRVHASPFAAYLTGHGFTVASVEYRRVGGDGGYPATFDDIAAAVDVAAELAVEALGPGIVDPGTVVLTGHSAGGHLVLWSAARHRLPADCPWHRAVPLPVCGVVALAPAADLRATADLALGDDAVLQLLGGAGSAAERIPLTDPARLLPTGIATTIVQGTTDISVPPQVAEGFAAAAAEAGQPVRLVLIEDVGHFPPIDPDSAAGATAARELRRLVDGVEGAGVVRPGS